ncbi:hypothetical protein GQX74_014805 [Glossina fuscipes]|nr:hypothetical protein GQX74_014805 [Glossina fuscipes]
MERLTYVISKTMNLEDLPRLESLSPIKDIIYHNLADQINLNRLEPQSSIAPMSSKNYLSKPYMLENNKSGNEPMLSGGLRYITQNESLRNSLRNSSRILITSDFIFASTLYYLEQH